jgi:hypothetical protein
VLSEGARYQQLAPAPGDLAPRATAEALADGLDGWSFLARTPARDFALAYFENRATRPKLANFAPGGRYSWTWFDPETGRWGRTTTLAADAAGTLTSPAFPAGGERATRDAAARIVAVPGTH